MLPKLGSRVLGWDGVLSSMVLSLCRTACSRTGPAPFLLGLLAALHSCPGIGTETGKVKDFLLVFTPLPVKVPRYLWVRG